jgi:hypothetical protein
MFNLRIKGTKTTEENGIITRKGSFIATNIIGLFEIRNGSYPEIHSYKVLDDELSESDIKVILNKSKFYIHNHFLNYVPDKDILAEIEPTRDYKLIFNLEQLKNRFNKNKSVTLNIKTANFNIQWIWNVLYFDIDNRKFDFQPSNIMITNLKSNELYSFNRAENQKEWRKASERIEHSIGDKPYISIFHLLSDELYYS